MVKSLKKGLEMVKRLTGVVIGLVIGGGVLFGQQPVQPRNPFCLLSQLYLTCQQIAVKQQLKGPQQCYQLEKAVEGSLRQVVERSPLTQPQRQQVEQLLLSTCVAGCLGKKEVLTRFQQLCTQPPQVTPQSGR